eukprot:TRINITY_DN1933_c1_g1_i3.p1 TRINITY_DN1933_c1_g1~~TRINITY_DN1933_c1_g1_i3.p1  ORF type:complete len:249 (+),score=40.31 TRINITY_DN1933_c1_g1_i3:218-964(+)
MQFSNSGSQHIHMIDSAVDKLRLAMSPNGSLQRNNNNNYNNLTVGNNFNENIEYDNSGMLGNNVSLPIMLAALNATCSGLSESSEPNTPTYKGVGGSLKGGLLLESDDSPRSMFGLHPELTPKIDNINILLGTPPTISKPPSLVSNTIKSANGTDYVHQREKQLYKTELCMLWLQKGFCEFGSQCKFAHSEQEKRNVEKNPKYKTKICRHLVENGNCPFGRRCHFLHPNEPPASSRLPIFQSLAPRQS